MSKLENKILAITGNSLQTQISQCIAQGLSTRKAANTIGISQTTIRKYAKLYGFKFVSQKPNKQWAWQGSKV